MMGINLTLMDVVNLVLLKMIISVLEGMEKIKILAQNEEVELLQTMIKQSELQYEEIVEDTKTRNEMMVTKIIMMDAILLEK